MCVCGHIMYVDVHCAHVHVCSVCVCDSCTKMMFVKVALGYT